jgi:hypothetical protein
MSKVKTMGIYLKRDKISDATGHWIVAEKVRSAGEASESLQVIWEQMHDVFALEVYCHQQYVRLAFTAAEENIGHISGALYTAIPSARIEEIDDFTQEKNYNESDVIASTELTSAGVPILPFLTYNDRQSDCMSLLLNIISVLPPENKYVVQWVAQRLADDALLHFRIRLQTYRWLANFPFVAYHYFKPGILKRFHDNAPIKAASHLFSVNFRLAVICPAGLDRPKQEKLAQRYLRSIKFGCHFTHHGDLGSPKIRYQRRGPKSLATFQVRDLTKPFMLSEAELGSFWHPVALSKHPQMAQVIAGTGSPPAMLPTQANAPDICFFGQTTYRNVNDTFGFRRADRRGHIHILGKSGSGKSKLLQLLAKSDIAHGHGLALVDCHGDLVDELLQLIPERRINDVVIFDVSDIEHPPSFNPFDGVLKGDRDYLAVEFLEMFKKIEAGSISDTGERVLRNALLAILEAPNPSVTNLFHFLADANHRASVIRQLGEGAVRDFWTSEGDEVEALFAADELFGLIRILARLLSADLVSNILSQQVNKFDFRRFIGENKIILIKIPKQNLGKANSLFLGSMLLAVINAAASGRAHDGQEHKDFYVYIDEFQNFATDSFAKVLTKAADNSVSYTVAHQMIQQLPDPVREVLKAKVVNLISFQVGGQDAAILEGQFSPSFGRDDLLNLDVRSFYLRMSIGGNLQEAFSGKTIDVVYPETNFVSQCIAQSRQRYTANRGDLGGRGANQASTGALAGT